MASGRGASGKGGGAPRVGAEEVIADGSSSAIVPSKSSPNGSGGLLPVDSFLLVVVEFTPKRSNMSSISAVSLSMTERSGGPDRFSYGRKNYSRRMTRFARVEKKRARAIPRPRPVKWIACCRAVGCEADVEFFSLLHAPARLISWPRRASERDVE